MLSVLLNHLIKILYGSLYRNNTFQNNYKYFRVLVITYRRNTVKHYLYKSEKERKIICISEIHRVNAWLPNCVLRITLQ